MSKVGIYEAKARFSELIRKVKTGQEIEITNQGKPVARLVPARQIDRDHMDTLVDETKRLRRTFRVRGISLRKIIDRGRP